MKNYLSVLDIADLPPTQRKIMRLILRKVEMTYKELCAAVEALPEVERLSRAELDQALQTLSQNRWLLRAEKDQVASYRVNLRRNVQETETLKPERRSVWQALTTGDEAPGSAKQPDLSDL